MTHPITVILTSCGRFDLLERTLSSFFEVNTYPIEKFVIYDDKGLDNYTQKDFDDVHYLQRHFNNTLWITPKERKGQIVSLDRLMREVACEYYFNLEDDWMFLEDGFIPDSIEILERLEKCNQVQLRGRENINGHPSFFHDDVWKLVRGYNRKWHGWGFNPSVRRKKDYDMLTSYGTHTSFDSTAPWQSEVTLGKMYAQQGFFTAVLDKIYIKHIGDGRGIRS